MRGRKLAAVVVLSLHDGDETMKGKSRSIIGESGPIESGHRRTVASNHMIMVIVEVGGSRGEAQ